MSFRCKHCLHHQMCTLEGKRFVYCLKQHRYPNLKFVEAWGCDNFEDEQLHLFKEERKKYGKHK